MAKLYFSKSQISQSEGLDERLSRLVGEGIERREKQSNFRSLYDIEILSVAVYYRKNWHYDSASQELGKQSHDQS